MIVDYVTDIFLFHTHTFGAVDRTEDIHFGAIDIHSGLMTTLKILMFYHRRTFRAVNLSTNIHLMPQTYIWGW